MPLSALHEVLIELLRRQPEQIAALLARQRGLKLDAVPVHLAPEELGRPLPLTRRADLIVLFGQPSRPQLVVVVEVQLRRDASKRATWLQYVAAAVARWGCDVELLVVTPHAQVARWAAEPIRINAKQHFRPLVLGPESLPREGPEALSGRPYPALLQTLMHCRDPADVSLLQVTLSSLTALSETDQLGYDEFLRWHLDSSLWTYLEVDMGLENTRFFKNARKALEEAKAEGAREVLLRVITRQLGTRGSLPGAEAIARIEALPLAALEQLYLAAPGFESHDDLTAWLAAH
ncbi:MAG: DUF4351 domain-containing protein [Candidatus Sericytochromatia bacterium]|nr:DUF4351 domain-containing protein [Candidatus Sericytochromatia bacterium]